MQPSPDAGLTEDFIIPIPSLTAVTSPGIVYVSYTRESPEDYPIASFQCILKFISKELDPSTGEPEEEGYEDEYQLEEVELSAGGDYIIPSYASFDSEWKKLESGSSATETFALSAMESLRGKYALTPSWIAMLIGLYSCLRLNYRGPQYGAPGRIASAIIHICAHAPIIRAGCWWWG